MRTGLWLAKVAVGVAVMAMVTTAMAQGQGGGRRGNRGAGGRGGFGVSPLALLQNETVQKDLELSDDQKASVTKLADEQQAQRGQGRGQGGGGFDPQAFQQRQQELQTKVDAILLDPQKDRLQEITLQVRGIAQDLADEKVADKLALTSDQKEKLTALTGDYRQKIRDLMGGGGPPDPQEMTKLRTEENDKAKALLTSDQQAQLDKMLGKKIDIDPASLFRGGRGGRGNRGGNAQPNA